MAKVRVKNQIFLKGENVNIMPGEVLEVIREEGQDIVVRWHEKGVKLYPAEFVFLAPENREVIDKLVNLLRENGIAIKTVRADEIVLEQNWSVAIYRPGATELASKDMSYIQTTFRQLLQDIVTEGLI